MTVAVIVISILLLSLITIVPVCTSIRGEKEREEKERERLNRELREEKEFFLRLWEDKVVRCKDCMHFAGEGMYCACNILVQFDHFYCYYGDIEERCEE